ncbi:MAG: Mut7-C RNAse domain-containing protein [Salinibacter sp.]
MSAEKHVARFRFYGSLNDFLSGRGRGTGPMIRHSFWGRPAAKDAIGAQGVPHPEVDLVLADGSPVYFEYALSPGDRISVYPWIQSLPRPASHLRPEALQPPRFVCDVHLGRLARSLRMLGLDTRYDTDCSDSTLAQISDDEDRILLTRDIGLLKRSRVRRGRFVRAQKPRRQLAEMARLFDVAQDADPLSRCLSCNVELRAAAPEAIDEQVPPHAHEAHDDFVQCPSCGSVFWAGSHVERTRRLIDDVTSSSDDNPDVLS